MLMIADPNPMQMRQAVVAELVGTFFLTLAALISGGPFAVALTLLVFVYSLGLLNGGSLNPAVSLGLMIARHISVTRGVLYIVAEIVGALVARAVAPLIMPLPAQFAAANWIGEFVGFGLLILAVLAVTGMYLPNVDAGLVIGGALLAGLLTTGGILNPAVAIAMGQVTSAPWAIWAPLLAAIVFAVAFRFTIPFRASDLTPVIVVEPPAPTLGGEPREAQA
jgi:aquaporin Z